MLHVLLAMLVTSVFFFWFVVSAIVHENACELLITVVLSAIIAVRTMYYVVSPFITSTGAESAAR